jgi:hypothetical protein
VTDTHKALVAHAVKNKPSQVLRLINAARSSFWLFLFADLLVISLFVFGIWYSQAFSENRQVTDLQQELLDVESQLEKTKVANQELQEAYAVVLGSQTEVDEVTQP